MSFFDGLHGLARWEGSFINDKPDGWGQVHLTLPRAPSPCLNHYPAPTQVYYPPDLPEGEGDAHGRWEGDIAVKGPMLEFVDGKPQTG